MSTSPFSLDAVRLAFECPMRWEKLARVAGGQHANGTDDAKRFCHTCDKHVHNLSAMSRAEAEALVRDEATPICVRIDVDAAGRSIHRPSRSAVLAGAVLAASLAGCVPSADSDSSGGGGGGGGAFAQDAVANAVGEETSDVPTNIAELGQHEPSELTGQARVTDVEASTIPEVTRVPPAPVVDQVLMGEPSPSIMGGIRPVDKAPLGRARRN